jgi:hypothetical protein
MAKTAVLLRPGSFTMAEKAGEFETGRRIISPSDARPAKRICGSIAGIRRTIFAAFATG